MLESMNFNQTLKSAILLRRYKRFLADVELGNGKLLIVHCPNTGSMLGCLRSWHDKMYCY
jgi:sugar fermentation stimulation protein A